MDNIRLISKFYIVSIAFHLSFFKLDTAKGLISTERFGKMFVFWLIILGFQFETIHLQELVGPMFFSEFPRFQLYFQQQN